MAEQEKLTDEGVKAVYDKIQERMDASQKTNPWTNPEFVQQKVDMLSIATFMQDYICQHADKLPSEEIKRIEYLIKVRSEFTVLYRHSPAMFFAATRGELFKGEEAELLMNIMENRSSPEKIQEILKEESAKLWRKIKQNSAQMTKDDNVFK